MTKIHLRETSSLKELSYYNQDYYNQDYYRNQDSLKYGKIADIVDSHKEEMYQFNRIENKPNRN